MRYQYNKLHVAIWSDFEGMRIVVFVKWLQEISSFFFYQFKVEKFKNIAPHPMMARVFRNGIKCKYERIERHTIEMRIFFYQGIGATIVLDKIGEQQLKILSAIHFTSLHSAFSSLLLFHFQPPPHWFINRARHVFLMYEIKLLPISFWTEWIP